MIESTEKLQKLHEGVYAGGKEQFFSRFVNGRHKLVDMKKRFNNALRDVGLPSERVDSTLAWLEKVVAYEARTSPGRFGGANALYVIVPSQ